MGERILIADDEPDVLRLVSGNLRNAGFEVLQAADGEEALALARREAPSLIVLDQMMPTMSGTEVCKALKQDPATRDIPVIMLTARAEEIDRVLGLELGADDYVTKPFSPREFVLRVKSVLRRTAGPAPAAGELLRVGKISLDPERCEVQIQKRTLDLTATEFKLLMLLMQRKGRVQTRDKLLEDVWGYESMIDTRTVDTHVRRLRDKLRGQANLIETVRGFGYRMNDQT